jgi:hypothetical protein
MAVKKPKKTMPTASKAPTQAQKSLEHKQKLLAEMRAERGASTSSPQAALGAQMGREYQSPEDMAPLYTGLQDLAAQAKASGHPQTGLLLGHMAGGLQRQAHEYWGKEGVSLLEASADTLRLQEAEGLGSSGA